VTEEQKVKLPLLQAGADGLSSSDQLFRLLVEGVVDYAIFMLDPEGRIATWNAGAQRLKGYLGGEIIGSHFSIFYTAEDRARSVPHHALAAAGRDGRFEAEGWRVRKDGTQFWASVIIDRILAADGTLIGYAKITRDLTERKLAGERIEAARTALFHGQKMEAIGQLTGGVAHDFNNLLTIISSNAEMLGQPDLDADSARRLLGGIQRAADRGARLTQQLLAFARRQPLRPQTHSIRALIGNFESVMRRGSGDAIALELNLTTAPDYTCIDGSQFEAALLNLVVNARDALPRGGTIRLKTRVEAIGESRPIADLKSGHYVVVTIEDDGDGMEKETKARAFEPFYTTKEPGKGSGLGLSQVYGFVAQSGGHVELESEAGVGTVVTLYLPVDDRAQEQAAADGEARRGRGIGTILLVEDDPDVMDAALAMLRHLGYDIMTAPEGVSALDVLQREPAIEILFTDIVMPQGINGIELARKARALRPDLKILLASGFPLPALSAEQGLADEFAFVSKPYRWAEISERLRALQAG
jgi:PAS domain S-box-containing protein